MLVELFQLLNLDCFFENSVLPSGNRTVAIQLNPLKIIEIQSGQRRPQRSMTIQHVK